MSIYDITANRLDGTPESLNTYRGKVLLVVNVASKCGFTPQYEALEDLHARLHERGFSVLGFPCDQFGHQEPGTAEEIASFCSATYGVTFPMFEKIDVNGPHTHPLYQLLKSEKPGVLSTEGIKWNFTKFLVSAGGQVLARYAPATTPQDIEPDILAQLGA